MPFARVPCPAFDWKAGGQSEGPSNCPHPTPKPVNMAPGKGKLRLQTSRPWASSNLHNPGCRWGQCNHSLENGRGRARGTREQGPHHMQDKRSLGSLPGCRKGLQEGPCDLWPLGNPGTISLRAWGRNEASTCHSGDSCQILVSWNLRW